MKQKLYLNLAKGILMTLFLCLGTGLFAQCTGTPSSASALIQCNYDIALKFAPKFVQLTDPNSGGRGLNGKADYITDIDFDNDWKTVDNWEALASWQYNTNIFKANSYYSVVWSYTHWFIVYGYYHPRDWTPGGGIFGICNADNHENDMEGLLVVVKRPTGSQTVGTVEAIVTTAHKDFYSATRAGSCWKEGNEDVDGTIQFWNSTHPSVWSEARGHGVYPNGVNGNIIITSNPCAASFLDVGFVSYYPSTSPSVPPIPVPSDWQSGSANYGLTDVFEPSGLWSRRYNSETFILYGEFRGDNYADAYAKAHWKWDDHNDNAAPGELATKPIKFCKDYFDFPGCSFSNNYLFNSYDCKYKLNASRDEVCYNQTVTFSISRPGYPLNLTSTNWSYNTNFFQCISGCNGTSSSITLKNKSSSGSGNSTVSVSMQTKDCGTINVNEQVQVGKPSLVYLPYPENILCVNAFNTISPNFGDDVNSVSWGSPPSGVQIYPIGNGTSINVTSWNTGTYYLNYTVYNGCGGRSGSLYIYVQNCNGGGIYREAEKEEELSVEAARFSYAPNPTAGALHLNVELFETSQLSLQIFDMSSRLVKNLLPSQEMAKGNHHFDFEISDLPEGIYLLRMATPRGVKTEKIVKVNNR